MSAFPILFLKFSEKGNKIRLQFLILAICFFELCILKMN